MEIIEQIQVLAENALPSPELFVVQVQASGQSPLKIIVLADGDQGITIDQCVKISRAINAEIEEKSLIETAYILEVSSPGASEPLVLPRQYPKHVGRTLAITTIQKEEKKGVLKEATSDKLLLLEEFKEKGKKKVETKEVWLAFEEIAQAIVQISFKPGKP